MKQLLKSLVETYGPSGYEESVRRIIMREVKPLADEVHVDALGNLVARKRPLKSPKGAKKIMLAAHMDEIGVIVSHVDKNGFVRFANIGVVFGRYVPGSRVRFLNGVMGVVGHDNLQDPDTSPPINKMYIDMGANGRKDCPVKVGDVAAFERSFIEIGDRIVAKSLDGRAGVTVLIETLRAIKSSPNDLYFVFTAQQEIGARGAGGAAFGIEPDIGIAVDVTPTGDTPASMKMSMELGKGPCIRFRDTGMIADARVVDWMIKTAEKSRVPYQREVLLVGSSDAQKIQISRAGSLAGALSIPVRYIHSASEMMDYGDLKNTVKLLTVLLRNKISL